MAVISFSREASKDEMGREIDRRGAVIDALTEERDRLKRERDEWQDKYDKYGIRFEKYICEKAGYTFYPDGRISSVMFVDRLVAERDRLAKANAELLAGLEPFAKVADQLHPGKYGPAWGFNKAIIEHEDFQKARALLTKHKATSTEREGE